ncbi:MAG: hypothetical protein H6739_37990 [Alphaproteobacteria bacterium]|nr:hypothetical protein [Alphaproteobacteria bacterium]
MASTSLSTRSDTRALTPYDGDVLRPSRLLMAEAGAACWRIVEAFSRDDAPFALILRWSSGCGAGAWAKMSVSRAARTSVFARSVQVEVANLAARDNRVAVTLADGFATTRNRWAQPALLDAERPLRVSIPPFADRTRVELAEPSLASTTTLSLLDGLGVAHATQTLAAHPADGVAIAGADALELRAVAATRLRVVFELTL